MEVRSPTPESINVATHRHHAMPSGCLPTASLALMVRFGQHFISMETPSAKWNSRPSTCSKPVEVYEAKGRLLEPQIGIGFLELSLGQAQVSHNKKHQT